MSIGRTWPVWALAPAIFAGAWGAGLAFLYSAGAVRWGAWGHPVPHNWSWTGFIHPPLYGEHQRSVQHWASSLGLTPGEGLAFVAAAMAPLVALLAAGLASRRGQHPAWAAYAALLMALSPTGLRPYEHYPVARLAVALALVTTLLYASRGGWWRLALAFAASLLASQLHLSLWFVLGPLLVGLIVARPERRRGLGALCVGLLLCFWLLASPNPLYENALLDVFDQPTVRSRSIFTPASFLNPTFELSNRWIFLPLGLWLVPALRRTEPRGLPLALGTGVFVAVYLLLMRRGYALHAHATEPHHYFELIEIAAVVGTTWLLAGAWGRWPGRRSRAAVLLVALALLGSQIMAWLEVNAMIAR